MGPEVAIGAAQVPWPVLSWPDFRAGNFVAKGAG